MRVAVGTDHAGFAIKSAVVAELQRLGHEVIDLGGDGTNLEDDYPDYSKAVGEAVQKGQADRGLVLCGSGVGAAVAANKIRGIRSCVCHDLYSARQGVEHDDMNVLCLGARIIQADAAVALTQAFIGATFSGEARHVRRLEKVNHMEEEFCNS